MPHTIVSGPSSDVSGLLRAWGNGDLQARNDLLPLVYRELRQQAAGFLRHEPPGHTLQPTALVHEVYLKLIGQQRVTWQNRAHFLQGSVDSPEVRRVIQGESGVGVGGSYLLQFSSRSLVAQRFDADRASVTGEAITIADGIESDSPLRSGGFFGLTDSVLAYRSASPDRRLVWFDRAGTGTGTFPTIADYLALSDNIDGSAIYQTIHRMPSSTPASGRRSSTAETSMS
jgi:hypothetical protein